MKPLFLSAVAALAASLASAPLTAAAADRETAVFGGGCFWTMQRDFERIPGVTVVRAGYDGGTRPNPSYTDIHSKAGDGYVEAAQVTFDPKRVSYARLVEAFWRMIDPLDPGGQACDRGPAYRAIIFVSSPEQRQAAETSKAALNRDRFHGRVVVPVTDATRFWAAPADQQDFAKRQSAAYAAYSAACRRDARLKLIWGKEAG